MGAGLEQAVLETAPTNLMISLSTVAAGSKHVLWQQVSNFIVGAGSKPALTTKPKIRENFPNTQFGKTSP